PKDLVADLDDLVRVQGEPFGSTSIYAQYRVFRLAKELGFDVLLDGQGADELLGGYMGFASALVASLLRQRRFQEARTLLRATSHYTNAWRAWLRVGRFFMPVPLFRLVYRLGGSRSIPTWIRTTW